MAEHAVRPIGVIATPFATLDACPRNGRQPDPPPLCRVQVFPEFVPGLQNLDGFTHLILLYWLHQVSAPKLTLVPPFDGKQRGVFATRSPARPNPIGLSVVAFDGFDRSRYAAGALPRLRGRNAAAGYQALFAQHRRRAGGRHGAGWSPTRHGVADEPVIHARTAFVLLTTHPLAPAGCRAVRHRSCAPVPRVRPPGGATAQSTWPFPAWPSPSSARSLAAGLNHFVRSAETL